jgi:outer membrane protein assembly factor BamB
MATLALAVGCATAAAAADLAQSPQTKRFPGWYQWRGPEQTGVSREKNLPETWAPPAEGEPAGKNLLWSNNIGGMSSPIVMNGKIYTFGRDGEITGGTPDEPTLSPGPLTQEAIYCVDSANGKVVWKYTEPMYQTDVPFHRLGWSNVVGDPSTGRVYGFGAQAALVCLDGETGKVVWRHQMTEEFGMISTFGGRTPSPTIDEDQVVIGGVAFGWGDNARAGHRLFALDKNTGELRWTASTGGLPVDAPYSTPVFTVVNGERLVITNAGDGGVHAFQARTGKKVWSYKASLRGFNDSPLVDGNFVFAAHDLDNPDNNVLGRVFCLDASKIENGAPKLAWKLDGIASGFPSATMSSDRLYVEDDGGTVFAIDKKSGKVAWKKKCGRTGKASLAWGDNKLYVTDADGKFWILKDSGTKADVLCNVVLPQKMGREYAIFGSVAIDSGRIILYTATNTYCIGDKNWKVASDPIPPFPSEEAPAAGAEPAFVQVLPADVVLHPGQKIDLTARAFDAKGRLLGAVAADKVKWAVGQVTLPPAPAPAAPPKPAEATAAATPAAGAPAAKEDAAKEEARAKLLAAASAAPPPAAAPTKAGNLKGEVDAKGVFTAAAGPIQGGAVDATVGKVTGQSRIRVFPALPWRFDFEEARVGSPPLTWMGAGGKFAVVDLNGNKALQKLTGFDLYYRARTYFGRVDQADYTVEADVMCNEKMFGDLHAIPDIGIINSRYVLVLLGNDQLLQVVSWPAAVPDDRQPSGAVNRRIPFPWKAKTWYHLKLWAHPDASDMQVKGKAWPKGDPEPAGWQLEMTDQLPNRAGSPGLFGNSLVGQQKSEIYYDNIVVTPNK